MKEESRIVYLDYLRIVAIFFVVLLHLSVQKWLECDINSFEFATFSAYDSVSRWCVPVLLMISGALFLKRDIPVGVLYKKNICRLFSAYFVWSIVYWLVFSSDGAVQTFKNLIGYNTIGELRCIVGGYYHLWYLPMAIGIYMCVPFIKQIVEKSNVVKYYMVFFLIVSFCVPTFMLFVNRYAEGGIGKLIKVFYSFTQRTNIYTNIGGYIFYFIAGYLLDSRDIEKRIRYVIYVLGVIGFGSIVCLSLFESIRLQTPEMEFYSNFNVGVLLQSIAVFTLFKHLHFKKSKVIEVLSKYSFGAYLLHVMIMQLLDGQGINVMILPAIVSVPVIGLLIYAIGMLATAVMAHIPGIKRLV